MPCCLPGQSSRDRRQTWATAGPVVGLPTCAASQHQLCTATRPPRLQVIYAIKTRNGDVYMRLKRNFGDMSALQVRPTTACSPQPRPCHGDQGLWPGHGLRPRLRCRLPGRHAFKQHSSAPPVSTTLLHPGWLRAGGGADGGGEDVQGGAWRRQLWRGHQGDAGGGGRGARLQPQGDARPYRVVLSCC